MVRVGSDWVKIAASEFVELAGAAHDVQFL